MEELYRVSREYYMRLESFQAHGAFKNKYLYIIASLALCFLITLILFLYDIFFMQKTSLFNTWFGIALLSEILMLFAITKFKDVRNKKITTSMGRELGKSFESVDSVRIELLKNYFSCEQTEFSIIAERVYGMLNRAYEFGNEKTNIEKVFNFIYEDNAKPRITTLLVMLFSIITILSIAGGQNINTVISSYSSIGYIETITLYGLTLLVCIAIGFGVSSIYKAIKKSLISLSLEYFNKFDKSPETIKYIIRDLNNYHEFKTTRDHKIILPPRING